MQHTPNDAGACVESELLVFGETSQILPDARTHNNWLKMVRAWRSDDNWKPVYRHRLLVSRHLGKVVLFPGDKS